MNEFIDYAADIAYQLNCVIGELESLKRTVIELEEIVNELKGK